MGLARLYEVVGKSAQSHDWAKRGLVEVEQMRHGFAELGIAPFQGSAIIPADALDQMEQQLRGYLEQ